MDFPTRRLNVPLGSALWVTEPTVYVVLGRIIKPAVLPEATILEDTLTSLVAVKVSVVLALHWTLSLILTLPLPELLRPAALCNSTWVLASCVASALPVISPLANATPVSATTLKSGGSTNQLPVLPLFDKVVMRTSLAIFTLPAEVSMKPPSPPLGALASKVPLTSVVPDVMSPISMMRPPLLAMVCA